MSSELIPVVVFLAGTCMSVVGVLLLIIFNKIKDSVQSLSKSVIELNQKLAVAVANIETIVKSIDDHESRLRAIEKVDK